MEYEGKLSVGQGMRITGKEPTSQSDIQLDAVLRWVWVEDMPRASLAVDRHNDFPVQCAPLERGVPYELAENLYVTLRWIDLPTHGRETVVINVDGEGIYRLEKLSLSGEAIS